MTGHFEAIKKMKKNEILLFQKLFIELRDIFAIITEYLSGGRL
jgi:hypothetical protein